MLQEQIPGNHPANYPALGQPIDELALAEIKGAILAKLRLAIGKDAGMATRRDWYKAAALALRDRIVHRWLTAEKQSYDAGSKRVYYLSLEFLIGRLFTDALNNMGLLPVFEAALGDLGVGLDDLRKCEPDAALGNGGLGRLAACFMESMATLAIPAIGYGIRYDFGLFRQIIAQGWQHEYPDEWLSFGNPWEFQRARWSTTFISAAMSIMSMTAAATARPGVRRKPCRLSPTTRRSWAGAASTSTRCGCGRRARPIRCGSTSSTAATISAPSPRRRARNRSANSSIRTTRALRGVNSGCGRNISSSPPRCRT